MTNLVNDGDMEALDTSAWLAVNNATLTKELGTRTGGSGERVLRVAYNETNYPDAATAAMILELNKTYEISGWARSDGVGLPRVQIEGGTIIFDGTTSTDWQYFHKIFTAPTPGRLHLRTWNSSASYVEYDDVILKDITGGTIGDGLYVY